MLKKISFRPFLTHKYLVGSYPLPQELPGLGCPVAKSPTLMAELANKISTLLSCGLVL